MSDTDRDVDAHVMLAPDLLGTIRSMAATNGLSFSKQVAVLLWKSIDPDKIVDTNARRKYKKSTLPAIDKFMSRVEKSEHGCWEWMGPKDGDGYGRLNIDKHKRIFAHRFSYEHFVGLIPDGLVIDHLCRNHSCVNPAHLEVVTLRENTLRGVSLAAQNARKTHCIRDHELTEDNVYKRRNGRSCRKCRAEETRLRTESIRAKRQH